jgi:hypothetical protein
MESRSPLLKKFQMFSILLIGLILIVFANADSLCGTMGSEGATGLLFFLYAMGWFFGWVLIDITVQKDMHMSRWLEGLILFGYLAGFTALWIWSGWLSFSARIFNWFVGIILIVIVIVKATTGRK